jgi:hypothetical protein
VASKDPDTKVTPPDPDTKVTPDPDTKVTPPDPVPDPVPEPEPVPENDDDGEIQLEDDGTEPVDPDGGTEPKPDPKTPKTPKTPKSPPKIKDVRDAKDLGKGFAKAGSAAKSCGKTNGALPGQKITVEAAIKSNGQVLSANATGPSRNTPLGKCVAGAVKSNARFVPSNPALQTVTHDYKM